MSTPGDGQAAEHGHDRRDHDRRQGRWHRLEAARDDGLPADHDRKGEHADHGSLEMDGAVRGEEPLVDRLGNREQVGDPAAAGRVVDHDVELAREDQHADASEHAVDHGGRDRTEPLAEASRAGDELHGSGEEHDPADGLQAVELDQLPDDDAQAGGRATHLERGSCEQRHDQSADDAGDQAGCRRDARSDGDAHAQGQGDQEHDDRGKGIPSPVLAKDRALAAVELQQFTHQDRPSLPGFPGLVAGTLAAP